MLGGPDTCRLGYAVPIQAARLRELGFRFAYHTFNLRAPFHDFWRITQDLAAPTLWRFIEAVRTLRAFMDVVDTIERKALALRPREQQRGTASRLRREALQRVAAIPNREALLNEREAILAPFETAPRHDYRPLRVGLVGDPYSIAEAFVNMDLEERLGYLGVEVERWFWLGDALRLPRLDDLLGRGPAAARRAAVAPYLGRDVGGFARPSLMQALEFARQAYDGLIHLAPFNCTPEIVAAAVLPDLARDYDVPVLNLVFDEHTSAAGVVTRLEAFVDLLRARRVSQRLENAPPLARAPYSDSN